MSVTNADFANTPWTEVAASIDGGPFEDLHATDHVYDLDLTNMPESAEVQLDIGFQTPDSTLHLVEIDEDVSFFIRHDPADYTGQIGGIATGEVTDTVTVNTGQQERVVVGPRSRTLSAGSNTLSLKRVPIGIPTGLRSAIGPSGQLPTDFSYESTTLSNNQDISSFFAEVRKFAKAVVNAAGLDAPRDFVTHSLWDTINDDSDDDADGSPCDDDMYAGLRTGATYEIPVASATTLPSNVLQSVKWITFQGDGIYSSTRSFFVNQPTFAPQPAPMYQPPTITEEPAPYQAFRVQGSLSGAYSSFHLSYRSTVQRQRYAFDMTYGFSKKTFNLTTPIDTRFTSYVAPSGSGGTVHYRALSYDRFAAPSAGETRFSTGITQYFGTAVMKPSLTVSGPSAPVTIVQGGTAPIPLQVLRTNFRGSVFVSPVSIDPGLTVGDISIPPGQSTATIDLAASTATPGMHTLSLIGDAIARGVEVPHPFTVVVNVEPSGNRIAP